MGRVLDADDGGCFDRMVAAIKLVEESILTAFVQQVRAEAMIKHDDRLAAYVPKKSRGHGQRVDKKPHSHSSLFLHVKSSGGARARTRTRKGLVASDAFKVIRDFSFLTNDEKRKLKEPKEKIPVTLMEPCGSESEMWLRQWNLKSSSTYVLTSSWKKVLERNHQGSLGKFKQNDIMQLWSFRHNGDLWLALFKVEEQ
ncbi:hypothetical protein GH714_034893 [Hevea brasiliensis]|uniref:TF-B3 domain-containing protein n=1 Tax=Hevea brasiliensis TaxID=3981 RepID=A0A6A6N9B5_HEVBR|nr:hypothetical protein GH714_034893 [Hevea brasiliensis]